MQVLLLARGWEAHLRIGGMHLEGHIQDLPTVSVRLVQEVDVVVQVSKQLVPFAHLQVTATG